MRSIRLVVLAVLLLASACSSSVIISSDDLADDPGSLIDDDAVGVADEDIEVAAESLAVEEEALADVQPDPEPTAEATEPPEDDSDPFDLQISDAAPTALQDVVIEEPFATAFTPGNCYASAAWKQSPAEVPCEAPHLVEVVVVGEMRIGPEFLGEQQMKVFVGRACESSLHSADAGLAHYVNTDWANAWPDQAQWDTGDRSYLCALVFDDPVTGSLVHLRAAAEAAHQTQREQRSARLELGGCYSDEELRAGRYVALGCNTPHDVEVFHVGTFSDPAGTPNPGLDALGERAHPACRQAFAQKMGVPLGQTSFRWSTRVPSSSWDQGGRRFVCLIRLDEPVSAPLSQLDPLTYGARDSLYGVLVGTCFSGTIVGSDTRTIVDCSEPHKFEVLATKAFDVSEPYPGNDAVSARSTRFCSQAVQNAGLNLEYRPWSVYTVWPSQGSWEAGDATVTCFAKHWVAVTESVFS